MVTLEDVSLTRIPVLSVVDDVVFHPRCRFSSFLSLSDRATKVFDLLTQRVSQAKRAILSLSYLLRNYLDSLQYTAH